MAEKLTKDRPVVVLGGGPAGLTAGYLLAKRQVPVIVLESQDQLGGLARTEVRDGFRFDLGGHRFFTKAKEVEALWDEIMAQASEEAGEEQWLLRPRQSRIYWNKKFLEYPLQGMDVIQKLGPVELTRAFTSYLWAKIKPKGREDTLDQWVTNRFGKRLFELFFKSYTEKVWGVPTSEVRAEWAAQRIKNLSFFSAAKAAFFGDKDQKHTSLIDRFKYPRFGPGQMWETMASYITRMGGEVRMNAPVTRLHIEDGAVTGIVAGGETLTPGAVISSLPLRTTVGLAAPPAAAGIQAAAKGVRYRDFLTVSLVIDGTDLFPDNWIYIHEPDVRVGRIQNFRSWSPDMVPDPTKASVGLEFFCFEGDDLWEMADEDLVELGKKELNMLGLARPEQVERGYVVRVHKAYPMYDPDYAERVMTIRGWLEGIGNLTQVGRNGLHRYNNSDHSMLTSMRAVENLLDDAGHDIWAVNVESVYHEEHQESEQPYVTAPETKAQEKPLAQEV